MLRKIILLTLLPVLAGAQESDLGNWFCYFGNVQINERWNWHNEAQYRNYNFIGDLEQLLLRTGIGYNLTEGNNNVLLGYGFIHSENYLEGIADKALVDEHRIFQQFITRQEAGRVFLQHRYRFEQRFIAQDFRLRFRYLLGLNIPLNHPQMEDHSWYVSMYNEIFLNSKEVIFDRNRFYSGLGHKLSPKLRFELGYMIQSVTQSSRGQVNMICYLSL